MFQFFPENPDQIELITCTCRGSRAVFQFYPENPDQIELITCTCRGSRAVFQFYPENPDQIELITTQEHIILNVKLLSDKQRERNFLSWKVLNFASYLYYLCCINHLHGETIWKIINLSLF